MRGVVGAVATALGCSVGLGCGLDTLGRPDEPTTTAGSSETTIGDPTDDVTGTTSGATSTGGEAPKTDLPSGAAALALSFSRIKQFDFEWMPVAADGYKLFESEDVGATPVEIWAINDGKVSAVSKTMPLHLRAHASYFLQTCDPDCVDSESVAVMDSLAGAIGYIKAANVGAGDRFGFSVALSGDGETLAVGAPHEASVGPGSPGDDTLAGSGAVYVFTRGDGGWLQQQYLKAGHPGAGDNFGASVALSQDGHTLAVGAYLENGGAKGIDQPYDENATDAGAVYVLTRAGETWTQQAYVKASNTGADDRFGYSVDISADGDTLAVGAYGEASSAVGVGADQNDDAAPASGAVYVFTRAASTWSQQEYIKASNPGAEDQFGWSVALAGDMLAIGAHNEDSAAKGTNGTETNDNSPGSGAVYTFVRSGKVWVKQDYLKANNNGQGDNFGYDVALSGDGTTIAVGAPQEDGEKGDVGGSGAVYVFTRDGVWQQKEVLRAAAAGMNDIFGTSVALDEKGTYVVVGAPTEDSKATGVDGDAENDAATGSGAAYIFMRKADAWPQKAYLKAANTDPGDLFGVVVAVSGDGQTVAIGADHEQGGGGVLTDNTSVDAGVVYLF